MIGLPLRYALRNLGVRRGSTLLTALGIAMTVAVFAGVLALRTGFEQLYQPLGRDDLAIYLRPGATSESLSGLARETADLLVKERPEIAHDLTGRPLAAAETYLATYMTKVDGGVTNVPLRGVQAMSLAMLGDRMRVVEGRLFAFGADEVVVGRRLRSRIEGCRVGDTLMLNITPFRVVGVFEAEGALGGEIWGDAERLMAALQRPFFSRVVARVQPHTDFATLQRELRNDKRTPVDVRSERAYLSAQTTALGGALRFLAAFLTVIMGAAAVLGAMNTMLAVVAARAHEIGVLLAIGFSRLAIFLSFAVESALIGAVGGVLGLLLVLPFDGYETGAMNWSSWTDVSFAFHMTPRLAAFAFAISLVLGVVGAALPAWRASRLKPVDAVRQL